MSGITHTFLDPRGFEDIILESLKKEIANRIKKEVFSDISIKINQIYEEETAKFSVQLTRMLSVERIGTDLRIIIHMDTAQEEKKK